MRLGQKESWLGPVRIREGIVKMSTAAKNLIIVPIGVIDDPEWNEEDGWICQQFGQFYNDVDVRGPEMHVRKVP